jgi:hypothetical protein
MTQEQAEKLLITAKLVVQSYLSADCSFRQVIRELEIQLSEIDTRKTGHD